MQVGQDLRGWRCVVSRGWFRGGGGNAMFSTGYGLGG